MTGVGTQEVYSEEQRLGTTVSACRATEERERMGRVVMVGALHGRIRGYSV